MDSIEIIYYDLPEEVYKLKKGLSLAEKIYNNPRGSWTVGENSLYRQGGLFVDFRLNGESLKEIIEEKLNDKYFDSQIFNLGTSLFFGTMDYSFIRMQIIRLMGNVIQEKDILDIYKNFNNKKRTLQEIRRSAKQEDKKFVHLTVCRSCGDYYCGTGNIIVERSENAISWDLSQLYNGVEYERDDLQYKYQFDAIEYIYEFHSFEKYVQELLEE